MLLRLLLHMMQPLMVRVLTVLLVLLVLVVLLMLLLLEATPTWGRLCVRVVVLRSTSIGMVHKLRGHEIDRPRACCVNLRGSPAPRVAKVLRWQRVPRTVLVRAHRIVTRRHRRPPDWVIMIHQMIWGSKWHLAPGTSKAADTANTA